MPSKKQRKANWTNKEIWILLEEVRLEKEYLMSSLTNEITNKKKSAIWQRIADKIAASCGVEHRSLVSVREKWGTLKSEAQRRRDKRKATGGGAVKECEYDNTIFDILGEGSNIADGIDDIPSTSATEKSVELVEEEVADSSLGGGSVTVKVTSESVSGDDQVSDVDTSRARVFAADGDMSTVCVEGDCGDDTGLEVSARALDKSAFKATSNHSRTNRTASAGHALWLSVRRITQSVLPHQDPSQKHEPREVACGCDMSTRVAVTVLGCGGEVSSLAPDSSHIFSRPAEVKTVGADAPGRLKCRGSIKGEEL
ncbi:hypothetical protein C0Q70_02507 [Pomacea canaliculata]|uniref:Myb-like domain-containing protein n=1 Tax=Pomacea canaliculata TaxID=400727 RepID=A0A2T7PQ42_POMCA|nr:hypothetical protein C0Q70_02507 [Pomacea canaliculata]